MNLDGYAASDKGFGTVIVQVWWIWLSYCEWRGLVR